MSETKLDIAFLREEIERHDLRWFDKTYTIVGKDEARALLAAAEERDRLKAALVEIEAAVSENYDDVSPAWLHTRVCEALAGKAVAK